MTSHKLKSKIINTEIIPNIKLFNAGIRKPIECVRSPHFIENITQSILYAINLKDAWVLVGGDGRTYSKDIIERIVQVLAGNEVRKVLVALHGHLPASVASCILRNRHCHFGFVITGGHHGPGDNGFIGLKIISPPGIPIREEVIDKANRIMKSLQSYSVCEKLILDFSSAGETVYTITQRKFSFEVIDIVSPYIEAIKKMFDLPSIKDYIRHHLKIRINCSGGVTGSIVKSIFVDELGVPERRIWNAIPLEEFGGFSANPNPLTCGDFVSRCEEAEVKFGAIISPDGCRCMIIEDSFTVPPSDCLAVIAAHHQCIPFFQENKLETIFRTICTSKAVDQVAESLSLFIFEVPVGWEHFSSAMVPSIGKSTLFGEESYGFGASSDSFCGDRDGIWTVLAWLSIISSCKKGVKELVEEHWNTYGRSFFGRLDFQNLSPQQLDIFLCYLREKNSFRFEKIKSGKAGVQYIDPFGIDPKLQTEEAKRRNTEIVFDIENYVYPYGFIKKSLLRDDHYQTYQIHLMDDARLVLRKSESIANSSTLRFYIEYRVEPGNENISQDREVVLRPIIEAAMKITKIQEYISSDVNPIFI